MSDRVREIDPGRPITRYARGWHCLGLAETLRDGRPHGIEAFGTKLVVFTDSSGALRVLDAYCRHMGGDLSQGTIKGDEIACPFHDWRWGGDGRCKLVPYAKRSPRLARTRSWPTLEVNGQLLVWNDPEGSAAPLELAPPTIEGYDEGIWSPWQWSSILIEGAHCREIVDNVVDMAHFFYIHYAFPTYFKNVFEGHTASQYMESKPRPDVMDDPEKLWDGTYLRSEATYFGPAYMINWLHNDLAPGFTAEVVLINCHYPVTPDSFVLQWGVAVQKMPGLPPENAEKLAAALNRNFSEGFLQDVEIWKNKTRIENPLLTEEDGPVYQLRRWYEQFYVDAADVTPDMTDRFEVEVDTTHAYDLWQQEVAANLAARHGQQTGA
ncbi:3-ketosteroid-9-alpha-hydroxylase oxygenase subunit [Mycolicibacterium hassiacum DSM 44199]|uniref:Rieske-type oxygenase n=1 Tax=Mycolicibacterium hassiacum (strain DSM 44199 / CIP 105218 / JCM 12690 / 3849) TaxID=1122247 RepID=K5BEJ1_MYCHD|nr:Rieske 2Fe-2S domain-containing protein [Mycolicibacterium hassiacum]EKF22326.1 3-ketosteroid-9-alpha-hydroxylase oxygenase subunit [Mycolicibacterium hassiacum DSM 44199]MDA4087402.1 3-ketosteroid-9-alpha-hydroxylase oxygenase subunit [Mycolicibacterium hassiacum DSM 44199]VCT91973.1 3-ketosteroid-9-alpha-monooxygenase, oxygenase component [Mycolicibacterium hassiacum DSM 44199]